MLSPDDAKLLVQGVVLPAALALVVIVPLVWLRVRGGAAAERSAGGVQAEMPSVGRSDGILSLGLSVALGASVLLAYALLIASAGAPEGFGAKLGWWVSLKWLPVPPERAQHWLPIIALLGLAVGVIGSLWSPRDRVRWTLRTLALLAALTGVYIGGGLSRGVSMPTLAQAALTGVYIGGGLSRGVSMPTLGQAAEVLALLAGGMVAWAAMASVTQRRAGAAPVVIVWGLVASAALMMVLSRNLLQGQLAGALAAGLGAAVVASVIRPRMVFGGPALAVPVLFVTSLVYFADRYGEGVPWFVSLLLLGGAVAMALAEPVVNRFLGPGFKGSVALVVASAIGPIAGMAIMAVRYAQTAGSSGGY